MCGRFALFADSQQIKEEFDLAHEPELPDDRYNIAPSEPVLAVCMHPNYQFEGHWFKWGLIPSWAKDESIAYKMINARAETIDTKAAFKRAFKVRRCLVAVNGFYEWHREGKTKQPYFFKRKDNRLFGIAAIWEYWKQSEDKIIKTCSLITTEANSLMRPIHNRMPAIIESEDYPAWLDIESYQLDELKNLLHSHQTEAFEAIAVSSKVNNARNEGPKLIEAIGDN